MRPWSLASRHRDPSEGGWLTCSLLSLLISLLPRDRELFLRQHANRTPGLKQRPSPARQPPCLVPRAWAPAAQGEWGSEAPQPLSPQPGPQGCGCHLPHHSGAHPQAAQTQGEASGCGPRVSPGAPLWQEQRPTTDLPVFCRTWSWPTENCCCPSGASPRAAPHLWAAPIRRRPSGQTAPCHFQRRSPRHLTAGTAVSWGPALRMVSEAWALDVQLVRGPGTTQSKDTAGF